MALCKALVVEPDPKTREMIDDILTTLDCTYEIADSLSQARKLLARSDHDLVLPAFDMPSRTGSRPRLQNAEHFMVSLRKSRSRNMPKVIMLITQRPAVSHEDIMRWAFEMRDLGVSDVVRKPLADEGRTLDRVIKTVMGLLGGDVAGPALATLSRISQMADSNDTSNWLSVTRAAELLMKDVPGLALAKARSRISTAAGRQEFKFTGSRKERRIEPHAFDSWRIKQRDRGLDDDDVDHQRDEQVFSRR